VTNYTLAKPREFDEIRIFTEPDLINSLLNCRGISVAKFFVDLSAFLAFTVDFIRDISMHLTKIILAAATLAVVGAIVAPNAQAQMNESYAGVSADLAFGNGASEFEVAIDGRYKIPASQFSARGSVYLTGLGVQATGTYDFPLSKGTGAYVGAGLNIDSVTSPVIQIGAETKLGKQLALYGGVDYLTRFEIGVAKVGVGYSF
jgi:hypothetical protein